MRAVQQTPKGIRKRDEDERRRIIAALEQCAGNQTKAAQLLGISEPTAKRHWTYARAWLYNEVQRGGR